MFTDPITECFWTRLFIILFQCFGFSREVCRGCSLDPQAGVDRRVVFWILFITAVIIRVTAVLSFNMSVTWRNLSRKPVWLVDVQVYHLLSVWLPNAILQISSYQILHEWWTSSHSAVFYWKSMNLVDSLIVFYSLIDNDRTCTALETENYWI